ncbi:MAG TPA: hypothetical protein VFL31_05255, partial [Nitrospiraceae bacterium]|nr:hypothetical protein [Nitrospiraceae bacterium]
QETSAAGGQFIGTTEAGEEAPPVPPSFELAPTDEVEAEASPPEPARVIEPEPALEPPAAEWQPVWQEPPPDPVKAMQLEPERAVAGADQTAGKILSPPRQATRFRFPKGFEIPSLASRLARHAAHVRLRVSLFIRGCIASARFLALAALTAVTGTLVLVVLCVGAVSIYWLRLEEKPNSAIYSLTKAPSRSLHDPKKNGYLLLLGFGAGSSRDPVQAGYESTLTQSEKDRVNLCLNDGVESSSPLRFEATTGALSKWFRAPDPVAYLQTRTSQVRNWIGRHDVLMSRYRQWLGMPFDDWGFGELWAPDCAQILVAHRLHIAEGFAQDIEKGVGRLDGDLTAWRTVLAQAKTLSVKMMAAEAINDNVAVLSGLLARSDLPVKLLPNLAALGRPLDELELSLRWPMQNQLVLEAKTMNAALKADPSSERPFYQHVLMRMPLPRQRILNAYASYYEAMIKAAETSRTALPKRYGFDRTPPQTFSDYLMNPIDNGLPMGSKPDWEEYNGRIVETDALLRLAGLQAWIRKPPQESDVLARVARAGQRFYDPFTGFPMLLNAKKGKLYSVGRNGKDDDGNPKLDVTVSIAPLSP